MRTPAEQAAFVAGVRRKRGIGDVNAKPAPVINRGAMKSLSILYPCMHRGVQVGGGTCRTCSGSIAVPVLSCALHERCTSHHVTEHDVPVCQLCRDRRQAPEEIPLAGFLNRFKGRTAWVFGRGATTFDFAAIADIADPCLFINEAVALDRYVAHDDCFWFALDSKHEYLLSSMRSLPVLHRDGWAKPGKWAGVRRVAWWTQATKQGPLLDRSREDTARLRELYTSVGTIQPLIHFAWLAGIDRLMLVGCDGLDPNGDGNYDQRIPDHSLKRPGASYSRIRQEQDNTMERLGIVAEYVGTPTVKVRPRPPGEAVKLPEDLKTLTGIDFATTTVAAPGRADILRRTYESFAANLTDVDLSRSCLYLNIDRGPDDFGPTEAINVATRFFGKVVVHQSGRGCFPAAVRWCWTVPQADRFFHLEDDWILEESIKLANLHTLLDLSPSLSCVNLRAYMGIRDQRICLSPGLWRSSHAKQIAASLSDDVDPEQQLRDGKQGQHIGRQWPDQPIIEDIGRDWMARNGLAKNNSKRLTAWTRI